MQFIPIDTNNIDAIGAILAKHNGVVGERQTVRVYVMTDIPNILSTKLRLPVLFCCLDYRLIKFLWSPEENDIEI